MDLTASVSPPATTTTDAARREQLALAYRRRPAADHQPRARRAHLLASSSSAALRLVLLVGGLRLAALPGARGQQPGLAFPGVHRDLASFCSARPSLSIELAPMLVHVKRNTSFNYKLYLFSSDEHVFQTGQIVPRDDFRIHSFPVKLKHLNEFVPPADGPAGAAAAASAGASPAQADKSPAPIEVYQLVSVEANQTSHAARRAGHRLELVRVPGSSFNPRQFFALVPLVPEIESGRARRRRAHWQHRPRQAQGVQTDATRLEASTTTSSTPAPGLPLDAQGDALPGDHHHMPVAADDQDEPAPKWSSHGAYANEHIEFDRDDQLAILGRPNARLRQLNKRHSAPAPVRADHHLQPRAAPRQPAGHQHHEPMMMPVGSFSSFRVNLTYLARKDFGQREPELVRLRVDAHRFQVTRADLLWPQQVVTAGGNGSSGSLADTGHAGATDDARPEPDDYAFLAHKLLRDPNTRLASITQVYEDWITRNFYTIVYIQRRLNAPEEENGEEAAVSNNDDGDDGGAGEEEEEGAQHVELVTDRLVFRGSSQVLLGADQLDYHVKASAFITEKNGLHYYLEFLPNGKFHLGAIDWTKRPFRFIDSQRLPMKATRTQFDNEELLLCPPSVCYSSQPIDELVAYGRLALAPKLQREASILARSSSSSSLSSSSSAAWTAGESLPATTTSSPATSQTTSVSHQSEPISLDNLIEAMRSGAPRLDVRLHLRDWTWQLARPHQHQEAGSSWPAAAAGNGSAQSPAKFVWHYEWARRNEIKVVPDTYGFALLGHEIDASYRVFNELYLISVSV
jgi:hypothetical protein